MKDCLVALSFALLLGVDRQDMHSGPTPLTLRCPPMRPYSAIARRPLLCEAYCGYRRVSERHDS